MLPHLVHDPVWSLKPWPVEVSVQGEEYTIPALCAADWLEILMVENMYLDRIFPGLLDQEDQDYIDEQLHSGGFDVEDMYDLSLDIISQVSGRKWWVTMRLIQTAQGNWDAIGGDMVMKADATRLSLSGWLDVLFTMILRNIENEKRTMFLMKLELPPEGWGDVQEELEMSADMFMSMAE